MSQTNASFIFTRRFLPIFLTQFFGAFNDNLFRQAVVILITFRFAEALGMAPAILTNLAIGLFILPYFLFSALAGQLADKFEKSRQIVWIKIWEVGLMVTGAFAFYLQSLPLMIVVLTGLGLQSTFFGPIKYGVLPDLMKREELLTTNALVEAGTFIAILLGTVLGGLLVLNDAGWMQVSVFMIFIAVAGTFTGWLVPKTGRAAPDIKISANIFASTGALVKSSWTNDVSRRAILGISWIWLVGTIFMAQIPDIVKNRLGGNEDMVTLFMACFSVGIGAGSLLCSKALKGMITAKLAAPGLAVLAAATTLLFLLLPGPVDAGNTAPFMSVTDFLTDPINLIITTISILIAMAAGVVIVPLYAILQDRIDRTKRSRTIAANNVINSGFMAGGSLVAAALIGFGLTSPQVLLVFGIANLLFVPVMKHLHRELDA